MQQPGTDNTAVGGRREPDRYGPLLAKVREELDQVEEAMRRVEDGSYGRCEACGDTLSAEQLDAFPLGRRCPRCS